MYFAHLYSNVRRIAWPLIVLLIMKLFKIWLLEFWNIFIENIFGWPRFFVSYGGYKLQFSNENNLKNNSHFRLLVIFRSIKSCLKKCMTNCFNRKTYTINIFKKSLLNYDLNNLKFCIQFISYYFYFQVESPQPVNEYTST